MSEKQPPKGGDPKAPALTPQMMQEWNRFLDWVKSKGYEGSKELDHNEPLAKGLFEEYKKVNPATTIHYGVVPLVQAEMQKMKNNAQAFASRRGVKDAANIMSGVSKIDGFFGSRTSQFRFPEMQQNNFHNNIFRSASNLGLVTGDIKPTGHLAAMKPIPKGVQTWKANDGTTYYTNADGDAVRVN